MKILFSPLRSDARYAASKQGEVLTVDGMVLDFSDLPKGATLPRAAIGCDWIAGAVRRDAGGELSVSLFLPHGAAAPEASRYPAPLADVPDGPVIPLPAKETAE